MSTVRISRKTAQWFYDTVLKGWSAAPQHREMREMGAALATKKPKPMRVARLKAKAAKRESKKEETARIRAVCVDRSGGCCEACSRCFPEAKYELQMDHFWGRGKVRQAVDNCWMLCGECHHKKTLNYPSRERWLNHFKDHCNNHGYLTNSAKARLLLESLEMQGRAVAP